METRTAWSLVIALLLALMVILQGTMIYMASGLPNVHWPEWTFSLEAIVVRNVLLAFFVGAMGAWAFHLGVLTGFISRTERPRILEFLLDTQQRPRNGIIVCFIATGGIVAAVFQAAQADTFAPIQAFVLGATWPSVVTRIMSGEGVRPASLVNPADTPSTQVPTPPHAAAVPPAEVTL